MDTPNTHGKWEIRQDRDDFGPPSPGKPQCNYCGSMHPDDFLAAIRSGCRLNGSDWKYGWPHKFYVDVPNPNPGVKRITSSFSEGGKTTDHYGTYDTIPLKFYAEHLEGWPQLESEEVREEIRKATGILYTMKDGKLMYAAPCHGYQR